MNIYTNHRKIYETHFGKIPKGYDIHHKDGNPTNNSISNLQLVTPEEHYNIHWDQCDYGACYLIAIRIKNPNMISNAASLSNKERVLTRTHNFLNENRSDQFKLKLKKERRERIDSGTHNFLSIDFHKKANKKRIEENNHHFVGGELQRQMIKDGRHASCHMATCEFCGKTSNVGNIKRWHGNNCKLNNAIMQ